jgi:hypothetical protein
MDRSQIKLSKFKKFKRIENEDKYSVIEIDKEETDEEDLHFK